MLIQLLWSLAPLIYYLCCFSIWPCPTQIHSLSYSTQLRIPESWTISCWSLPPWILTGLDNERLQQEMERAMLFCGYYSCLSGRLPWPQLSQGLGNAIPPFASSSQQTRIWIFHRPLLVPLTTSNTFKSSLLYLTYLNPLTLVKSFWPWHLFLAVTLTKTLSYVLI